ncbi:MAG: protein kinase [Planctomycetota bacterium]
MPSDDPGATPGEVSAEMVEAWWGESVNLDQDPSETIKARGAATAMPAGMIVKPHTVARASRSADPAPDYELLDVLGKGGMGVVHIARQTSVGRTIALKMMKEENAADEPSRKKFLCEAAVMAELEHPNIVPVHDLGASEDGQIFYAMRHVKGVPWKDVIRKKSQAENINILLRVADAVAFAHSKGIIHRDLKPANVMLGDFGEVLVMDWGLALSITEGGKAERITRETVCAGSPSYMAPEMAAASAHRVSPASDIYLLGAILFEILTGYPPHTGKDLKDCVVNAANNVIRPTDKRGELLDIALKAMAAERTQRYLSVKDFQDAVRDYQSHAESLALSQRAQTDLARGRETKNYDNHAQALYGFREALALWEDNQAARQGAWDSALAYAQCAFEKDDLDLAASLLTEDTYEQREILKRVTAAQRRRSSRRRAMKVLKRSAIGLMGAVMLVLAVAVGWVHSAKREAERQRDRADQLAQAEAEQRRLADLARQEIREEAEAFADVLSLASTIGHRDEQERQLIRSISLKLAERVGMEGRELRALRLAANIMDVARGRVMDIFDAEGPPTPSDFKKILDLSLTMEAATNRVRLLRDLGVPFIIRTMWESWDGRGYPGELAGERIPMGARVLKVAWVYALFMRGAAAAGPEAQQHIVRGIRQQRGKGLDPVLVDHLMDLLDGKQP